MEEQKYYSTLPRKRMGAGVIFLNEKEEILLVKPTYRTYWILPGGVVEKDESPRTSAIRELEEELGLKISELRLLCVDWKSTKGPELKDEENIQFIFFGGVMKAEQVSKISLQEEELSEYAFFSMQDALSITSGNMQRRLPNCLDAIRTNSSLYLEDGELL